MIVNDLRSRRDALSLAHKQLKMDSDSWNKCVIVLSLGTSLFESAKIQIG
jgi:two-component sensor histidine kinase